MKLTKNNKQTVKKSPLRFAGSILAASLLLFGAASCGSEGETTDYDDAEGITEEPYTATEPVANNEVNYFDDWDTNDDRSWTEEEFRTGISSAGLFDEWDTDNNDLYSENEFNEGWFNRWDEDNDGFLSNEEYTAGYGFWEDDYGYTFDSWDANNDNLLDTNEVYSSLGTTNFYEDWDTDDDGFFNENEMYSGLYNSWDTDRDGNIAVGEYDAIGFEGWNENI